MPFPKQRHMCKKCVRMGDDRLTFKATLLSDSQLMIAGFVEITPIIPLKPEEAKRRIWATRDIWNLIKGHKNPNAGFPALHTDLFIGRFCKGYSVSVSRNEKPKAELKWLQGHEQVWSLAFRTPPPGWRVMGRFARKNVFVAMTVHDRHELGNFDQFNEIVSAIPTMWETQFPGVSPYTGATFGDYVGGQHRNDDE